MPTTPLTAPDNGPLPTGTTVPATGDGRTQGAWDLISGHANTGVITVAALIATVGALWYIARKAKTLAKADRPDDKLATIGMVIGLGWSGEAMWVIGTKLLGVPWPVMVVLLFALEVNLSVAMIRAVRHYREHGHPGGYGQTAWIIAASIALIAAFASHSIAEVALRIAVPLLVTKTWWDGLTANEAARRLAGAITWRWTPRRLLLWIGAIEPGEKDVETVNRERVTQQMTRLYYLSLYGWKRMRPRRRARLARLTLVSDDAMIREVMRRVTRTSWTTAQPLPYDVTHNGMVAADAGVDAVTDATPEATATRTVARQNRRVEVAAPRRVKTASRASASGDASDADPAMRAARLYLTQPGMSHRKAADAIGGTSEGSVRRALKRLEDAAPDAPAAASPDESPVIPMTPIPAAKATVTHGVNGRTYNPEENQ